MTLESSWSGVTNALGNGYHPMKLAQVRISSRKELSETLVLLDRKRRTFVDLRNSSASTVFPCS